MTAGAALSRRGFVVGAGGTLLLAGCAPVATPTPTPTGSLAPLGPTNWQQLAAQVTGKLMLPSDVEYPTAKLTENPRFDDAMPLAILEVASAADVAAALAFAASNRVPIALRAGGHNYVGWSAGGAAGSGVAPSLVISTASLQTVTLSADGTTVEVGAGATLAQVYSAVGSAGRAIAGGSCATVGATGLTLGGGVGVLVRSFGLICDQLTAVEIVTADGVVHTASATQDSELFWGCQGGGGGHLGVVTKLSYATQPAPAVTMYFLEFPFAQAAEVVTAWQGWAPGADNRLWSTLKLLGGSGTHPNGPSVTISGTWTGPKSELEGQLGPLLSGVSAAPIKKSSIQRSYLDAMMAYAGCLGVAIEACTTAPGGHLTRESSSGTSSIGYDPLDAGGIADLIAQVESAKSVAGLKEGGISMDALGGKVGEVAPSATAFPHRAALMTVQYTGTFLDGVDPSPIDAFVRGFRAAMTPHWGDHAYVNYADGALADPGTAYFGDNLARLRQLKKTVDPNGLFAQPQGY